MFKLYEIAIVKWSLGQQRNRYLFNHLFDNHDFWLQFDKRNIKKKL